MTYIIAELGSVHDGSLGNALRLIEELAALGTDAVKLQCHTGERIKGEVPWFSSRHESRAEYLARTGFDRSAWGLIRDRCSGCCVDLIVSPFSVEAVALLEELPVDAYKIASGQVTNLPMLDAVGKAGRRVIMSSGMTTDDELNKARETVQSWAILLCTSEYPCAPERVGLNVLTGWLAKKITYEIDQQFRNGLKDMGPGTMFGNGPTHPQIGLSDHTLGFAASLAAIALGATVIERHVCFDRRGYGTDCAHSLTLDEFGAFVKEVRALDVMLANPVDKDALAATPAMQKMRATFLEQP